MKSRVSWLVFAILVSLSMVACQAEINQTESERTLASLKKVDDSPLYTMTYYGDYGFADSIGGEPDVEPSAAGPVPAWGCTTFAAMAPGAEPILGRNFDWQNRATLLLFTDPPDGYASASLVDMFYLTGWESDREALLNAPFLPFDGMNEHGLAIGMMALDYSQGPADPAKRTLGSLGTIRLLLDYAKDVDEAIGLLGRYNISFTGGPPVHYLIADPTGHSAVIEYIGGEMRVLRNEGPWQVSTNFVISDEKPVGAQSSCWRYNEAYRTLEASGGQISADDAMGLLEDVSQGHTVWSVVYSLQSGKIQVAVGRNYGNIHAFQLRMGD